MKTRNVVILVTAAVALSLLAFLSSLKQMEYGPSDEGKKVLPDLPVNDISRIVITDGNSVSKLVKTEDNWVAANQYNYPVKFKNIRDALLDLHELKVGQLVNADPEQIKDLKLLSPREATENAGILMEMYTNGSEPVAHLLLGRKRMSKGAGRFNMGNYPSGRYVSPDGGKTVYLVSETLNNISVDITDWMDNQIVHVPSSKVREVTLRGPNREPFTLTLDEEEDVLKLTDLAENLEMNPTEAYSLRSALSYFRFDDIADPSLPEKEMGLDDPSIFTVKTKAGTSYTIRIGSSVSEDNPARYVQLSASKLEAKESEAENEDEDDQPGDEDKETEDSEAKQDPAEKVRNLNRKFSNWTYIISEYKIEPMLKSREDLTKEKVQEDKPQAEERAKGPEAETAE